MKLLIKLILVPAFALMLVPYSLANELLPPDIIRMLEAPTLQINVLITGDGPKIASAGNPSAIKSDGMHRSRPVVQHQSLNELLSSDIIRMWVFPFDP